MKISIFVVAYFFIFFLACRNSNSGESGYKSLELIRSFEMYGTDTVNITDRQGRKQGKWIPSVNNKSKDTVYYRNDSIIQ